MANTFWAVFFGSAIGLLASNLIITYIEEFYAKKRHQRLHDLLDHLEDVEFEDIED
jgi:hypothetical protein